VGQHAGVIETNGKGIFGKVEAEAGPVFPLKACEVVPRGRFS